MTKLTTEQFKERIYKIHGDEYSILGEYKGTKEPILVRHNKCGREYEIIANNLRTAKSCMSCIQKESQKCKNIQQRKSQGLEKFKQKVYNLVKDEYIVLSDTYINNKTKILMKHNTCGHEWELRPNDFQQGKRCPKCAMEKRKKSLSPFIEERRKENYLENLVKNEDYEWQQEYSGNNKDYHNIKHIKCGKIYKVRPNDFQQGYRCPECSLKIKESKHILYIKEILYENSIDFKQEVTFKKCRNERKLPFDLYFNNFIIEYDGKQHFFKMKGIYEKGYEQTKINDKIKNDFMLSQNKYKFLRLHYKLKNKDIKFIINKIIDNSLTPDDISNYNLFYYDPQKELTLNTQNYYTQIKKDYFDF